MRVWKAALSMSCVLVSATVFAFADLESKSAEQKASDLWTQVLSSRYGSEKLPPILAPTTWDQLSLLNAEYDSKAFSHNGDRMIEGREKLIHGFGTTISIAFVPASDTAFTGLLRTGAPHGLLRLSLAVPPSNEQPRKLVPGVGIKFFVDGKASLNVMAMPSLDGQYEENLFAHNYTTNVGKPAWSLASWLIEQRFQSALSYVGQDDGNPRSLSLEHFANITATGEKVENPVAPFSLSLVPSKALYDLFESSRNADFRARLEEHGAGIVLFEVFANGESGALIGKIVAKSNFVASKFGDKHLFFKHAAVHTWSQCPGMGGAEL